MTRLLFAALALGVAGNADAALNSFLAGMTCSGSAPFDATDTDGCSGEVISTYDTATYLVGYSNSTADTDIVVTAVLPTTPVLGGGVLAAYSGAPIAQSAYFKLTDLDPNCQNVSAAPVAAGSTTQSGVTADGTKMICVIASSSAQNLLFRMTVAGLPNGSTQPAPTFTYQSATVAATTATPASNAANTPPMYGLPALKTASRPRWNLDKSTNIGGLQRVFVPGSGPNGEDGFVMTYSLGIYATGSRKGLEPLDPNTVSIAENFADPDVPNAQLVNWNINNGYVVANLSASGQNGCGDWYGQLTYGTQPLDNYLYRPTDQPGFSPGANTAVNTVANGGACNATAVDNLAKTATLSLTGTDYSLAKYPIYLSVLHTTTVINVNNLDDANNQWWVASKSVLIWAPVTDFTPNVATGFTNKVTLAATSITGQANTEPTLADNAPSISIIRFNSGGFSKRWTPLGPYAPTPALQPTPRCDPAVVGSCNIQSASPGQFTVSQLNVKNGGTGPITNSLFCDKIDNARVTFVDARGQWGSNARLSPDSLTGIATYWYLGPINSTVVTYELGVGGSGTSGGSWVSESQQLGYGVPSLTTSTQATSGCGDADAAWYPSIDALTAAGHTLSEITRVRGKMANLGPSVSLIISIPLKVNATFAYATIDIDGGNLPGSFPQSHAAGDSAVDTSAGNQAFWDVSQTLNTTFKAGQSLRITQDEYATIGKTSTTHPLNGQQVATGAVVTYSLQVNLTTSSTAGHTTTVTITDVLPRYVSYLSGTAKFGGVPVASIPGASEACTPDTPLANVTQCVWTLPNQTVTPGAVGAAAANIPALTFDAFIDVAAPNSASLLNSSKVHTTGNLYGEPATYTQAGGFLCAGGVVCSVGNWTLNVTATAGVVLSKTVDSTVVPTDTGFSYGLIYSAVGQDIADPALVDVLPYANDGRTPASGYAGTFKLAGPIAAPVAGASPPTLADATILIYYTSNAPANISRLPLDASQDYTGAGTNSASHTVWCLQSQFGTGACPAGFDTVTAFAALPKGQDGSGTLHAGESYKLVVPMSASGNAAGNVYSNGYVFDSSSLVAHNPGSNMVSTTVVGPDLVMTKTAPATATSGGAIVYSLGVKNNTTALNPNVGPVLATPAPGIVVADTLPSGITFAAASDVGGTNWNCAASTPPSTVRCTYDNSGLPVPIGGQVGGFITIDATVAGALASGTSTNTACVAMAGQAEAPTANNCSSVPTAIVQKPDLKLTKTATPGGASSMRYDITVENVGISASSNPFTVTDTVPAGVRVDSVTGNGVSCGGLPFAGDGTAQMTCTIATQLAGTGADANGNPIGTGGGTLSFSYATTLLSNYAGAANTACANDLLDTVVGNNCGSSLPQPRIAHSKSIGSGPTATGNLYEYTITYSIPVVNNGAGDGTYDLVDTLNYSSAVTIGGVSATRNGIALAPPLGSANQVANTLATAQPLASGATDMYLVTVVYTVLPGSVTTTNSGCANTSSTTPGNGTLNVTALTTGGITTNANACAPIVVPTGELDVTKSVSGGPAGYSGSFTIHVACTVNGNAVTPLEGNSQAVMAGMGSNGSLKFTQIPQGATCTVSEGALPAALPTSYVWVQGTPTITQPSGPIAATPVGATVVNTLMQQVAGLTVIKTVQGAPSGYSGSFPISVACTLSGAPVSGIAPSSSAMVTAGTGGSGSAVFQNIPEGSVCTVNEGALPTAPASYLWSTPAITQSAPIAAAGSVATIANKMTQQLGTLIVTKTVAGGPNGYRGAFAISAACTLDGAAVTPIEGNSQTVTAGASGNSVSFTGIPQGAACTVGEGALPANPTGYAWGTPSITQPAAVVAAAPISASVINTLTAIDPPFTLTKTVAGGPASGVSGTFTFTIDCGAVGTFAQSITLTDATSGSVAISNIPFGTNCTFSESASLPAAPSGFVWGALPVAQVKTIDGGNVGFVNTLDTPPPQNLMPAPVPALGAWALLALASLLLAGGLPAGRRASLEESHR